MNLDVTIRAISVLRVQVMLRTCRLFSSNPMGHTVTSQTELRDPTGYQQSGISRAMWRMAGNASVGLHRSVFINKRTLLIRMTFNASCIGPGRQPSLFQFETAMRVMAISAAHRAFKNFVVKRLIELVLYFRVTIEA